MDKNRDVVTFEILTNQVLVTLLLSTRRNSSRRLRCRWWYWTASVATPEAIRSYHTLGTLRCRERPRCRR